MRRIFLFLLMTVMPSLAQQYPTTPNIGLSLPPYGVPNWQIQVNGNFTILDNVVGALQVPYQGVWISTYAYTKGQIVTYNGALYMSKIPNNLGNNPSISSASWQFVFQSAVSSLGSPNNTLTVSPMSGNILADINLSNTNIWTGSQTFSKLIVTDTAPTFSGIAGASTFCLQISSLGVLSNTGAACGSGGGGGVNPSSVPLPLAFYNVLTSVSPTLQTGTTTGPTWNPGPGQFSTPNAYGAQNPYSASALPYNRDNGLNSEVSNPITDHNAAGLGTNENGDDCDAIRLKILDAYSQTPGPTHDVKLGGKFYRCTTAHAYALLPRDFGGYNTVSTGTGASAVLTIDPTTGSVTGCAAAGGGAANYNPNSYLPVQIFDPTYHGSGASVYLQTNGSGVPSSCTVEFGGINYPQTGVLTTVFPIGADGATATFTLSGGSLTSTTGTVVTVGSGYSSAPPCGLAYGASQLQGTSIPNLTCTVSGGQITGVTASTTGSGLTWNGSPNGTVTVCIGACIGGVQATNIAPETAQEIGIAIPLLRGTTLDCEGGTIQADYLDGLANTGELAVLGDPWGQISFNTTNGEAITIKNCHLGGFADVWFAGPTSDVYFINDTFAGQPSRFGFGSISAGPGSSVGVYMPAAWGGVHFINSIFNSNLGVYCGGVWASRTGWTGGLGSIGGIDVSEKTVNSSPAGDACQGVSFDTATMYNSQGQSLWPIPYLPPTISSLKNNYSAQLDAFFEQFIWKAQNTSLTNAYAPNGQGTCYSSLTIVPRATDYAFGNTGPTKSSDPWFACFRGASDMILVAASRHGSPSSVSMNNITNYTGSGRPYALGTFSNSVFTDFNATSGRTYSGGDPYLPPSTKEEGIIVAQTAASSTNTISGLFAQPNQVNSLGGEYALGVSVTTLNNADISNTVWSGIISLNSQPTFSTPPATTYTGGVISGNFFDTSGGLAFLISAPYIFTGEGISMSAQNAAGYNISASNTFFAPGSQGRLWNVTDYYWNGTAAAAMHWQEQDAPNTALNVPPTALLRTFSCAACGLPMKDSYVYPSGSTWTINIPPNVPAILNSATQTSVACSGSGFATFSQPEQGTSDKRVTIHLQACTGTASYTFPTSFTNTPSIFASNNVAAAIVTSISQTAVTVTGSSSQGALLLEDY